MSFTELTDEQRAVLGDEQATNYDDLLVVLEEIEVEECCLDDRKYEAEREMDGIIGEIAAAEERDQKKLGEWTAAATAT